MYIVGRSLVNGFVTDKRSGWSIREMIGMSLVRFVLYHRKVILVLYPSTPSEVKIILILDQRLSCNGSGDQESLHRQVVSVRMTRLV